jgi:hypothetical protein
LQVLSYFFVIFLSQFYQCIIIIISFYYQKSRQPLIYKASRYFHTILNSYTITTIWVKGSENNKEVNRMFIGSFYRVGTREEMERNIPIGSAPAIVYVESEGKLYEKNRYGMVAEYRVNTQGLEPRFLELENQVKTLETAFQNLAERMGGGIYEI